MTEPTIHQDSYLYLKDKYVWRELTSDGLLKSPEDAGAYYEAENVNGYGNGYDSIAEAEEAYLTFYKKHGTRHSVCSSLVLIKETHVVSGRWWK